MSGHADGTTIWLVLTAIVMAGLLLAQLLAALIWSFMRENPTLAARTGWFVALVATLGTVNWYWFPHHVNRPGTPLREAVPTPYLVGEGIFLLLIILLFIFTHRRRQA